MSTRFIQFFHCMTPLHNGAGQGVGGIDRPIVREVTTGYPFVQSSTVKGAYAARARATNQAWPGAAFGRSDAAGNQGCLLFSDAWVLFFPVRSLAGTMAWVTSPLALARFARAAGLVPDLADLAMKSGAVLPHAGTLSDGKAIGASCAAAAGQAVQALDARLQVGNRYFLEGLALEPIADPAARAAFGVVVHEMAAALFTGSSGGAGFWQPYFGSHALLISENDFRHVVEHATEVEANIRIEPSGVTADGSLRYTEFLPAETVLYALLTLDDPLDGTSASEVRTGYRALLLESSGAIQLGADESKGKGVTFTTVMPPL